MKVIYASVFSSFVFLVLWFNLNSKTIINSRIQQTHAYVECTHFRFGVIQQNKPKQAIFDLKNIGNSPLLIQNVETSCGCVLSEWTKHPIKSENSGKIKITYDAKNIGRFHKTVAVFANVEGSPIRLFISGKVN